MGPPSFPFYRAYRHADSLLLPSRRLAVDTFLVDLDGMLELDVQLGQEILVLVAIAAGLRQVRGVNLRLRIGVGQDVVAAMEESYK